MSFRSIEITKPVVARPYEKKTKTVFTTKEIKFLWEHRQTYNIKGEEVDEYGRVKKKT